MKMWGKICGVAIAALVLSCQSNSGLDFDSQLKNDVAAIDAYLTQHSIDAIHDPSGLRYVITSPGTGAMPTIGSQITVKYKGTLLSNGNLFDQATTPIMLMLDQNLIAGWQIALPLMHKGSKFTLYLPSGLAYGNAGSSSIPPNANIVFDIELIDESIKLAADLKLIDSYLSDSLHTNPDSIHVDPAGVRYLYKVKGTGNKSVNGGVVFSYTGKFFSSKAIFATQGTPIQAQISDLPSGFQTTLPLIPAGSQITMYIPSGLAYGPSGSSDGKVPPDAILIFDITLASVF